MDILIIIVVGALAAFWVFGRMRPQPPAEKGPPQRFDGPGEFRIEAVGESHYQDVLERIVGGRGEDSAEHTCTAILSPEPNNQYDKNAVAVLVEGEKVGNLNRANAARFGGMLEKRGLHHGPVEVRAVIRGGWDRGNADRGSFGVFLDL